MILVLYFSLIVEEWANEKGSVHHESRRRWKAWDETTVQDRRDHGDQASCEHEEVEMCYTNAVLRFGC